MPQACSRIQGRVELRGWFQPVLVIALGLAVAWLAEPLSAKQDAPRPLALSDDTGIVALDEVLPSAEWPSPAFTALQAAVPERQPEQAAPVSNQQGTSVAQADGPAETRRSDSERLREAALTPFRDLTGEFGIAVKDLGSGQTVLLNESRTFPAASLYKLPVMYEVYRLRSAGELSFDETLVMTWQDAAFDMGSPPWPIGTQIGLGAALEVMITLSDNSSAIMLTRRVDVARLNQETERLGLGQTHVRLDDLVTSPRDMLSFLELLAGERVLDSATSSEMIRLLMRQQVRDRIPALLPEEAIAANKTGDWEDATHDVGLVFGPRATLALAFLSEGIDDRAAVHSAIARATRDLYDLVNDPSFATQPHPLTP
jgi:beta-lactamase class A